MASCCLPFAYSAPATPTTLLFLEHTTLPCTPGLLHLLFPLKCFPPDNSHTGHTFTLSEPCANATLKKNLEQPHLKLQCLSCPSILGLSIFFPVFFFFHRIYHYLTRYILYLHICWLHIFVHLTVNSARKDFFCCSFLWHFTCWAYSLAHGRINRYMLINKYKETWDTERLSKLISII